MQKTFTIKDIVIIIIIAIVANVVIASPLYQSIISIL